MMRRRAALVASFAAATAVAGGAAAQQRQAPVRVLAFGDSNTWGWAPRAEGFPTTRLADDLRWPGVLASILGAGTTVLVDGLVGRTTSLERQQPIGEIAADAFSGARTLAAAIAAASPLDAVVLMLGTNDLQAGPDGQPLRSASEAGCEAVALADIVRRSANPVFTAYPAPRVLVVAPVPLGDTSRTPLGALFAAAEAPSRALGAAIAAAGRDRGVPTFDAAAVVPQAGGLDGIHLTVAQHAALGTALATAIQMLLRAAQL